MLDTRILARATTTGAVVALIAGLLACSGFNETCSSETFVPSCIDEKTYQVCARGYGFKAVVTHRSCQMNEMCLLDEAGEPTCGIGPPLSTCDTEDDRRCVGEQLQRCHGRSVRSADGEMFWSHYEDCARDGQTCVQHGNAAGCVTDPTAECSVHYLSECNGNVGRVCYLLGGNQPEGDPKGFWSTRKPAADDEVCLATDARVVYVAAPPERCFVSDEPRCVNGRLQKCLRAKDLPRLGPVPEAHWAWTDEECP